MCDHAAQMGGAAAALVAIATVASANAAFYRPYGRSDLDLVYNLLFCDDPRLFESNRPKSQSTLAQVLSATATTEALERIADSDAEESRVRLLAYNRLRGKHARVTPGILLGVVVEVPVAGGLDVLAVFKDGRIRYVNHSGRLAVIETPPDQMAIKGDRVMRAGEAAIGRIGPWDKARLPPPQNGRARLTFLVSDGLYFGEGPRAALARDAVGGPVLSAATDLLLAIVNADGDRR